METDSYLLNADDEIRRLWTRAESLMQAEGDLTSLLEAVDLGARVVEIAVASRLQPIRDAFPATIASMLAAAAPELNVFRDAIQPPHVIGFTDAIDLLSEQSADCVAPGLHRGWEDRRFSCRRSRETATRQLGITLSEEEQRRLLRLSAYRNRVFRLHPPVEISVPDLKDALVALRDLASRLTA